MMITVMGFFYCFKVAVYNHWLATLGLSHSWLEILGCAEGEEMKISNSNSMDLLYKSSL